MKKSLLIITLLLSSCLFAQVGINTTNPKAQLDIKASNQVAPQNTDGILIPRIDAFPVTNPTVDQNGMLIFLTTDNKFYYWKNATSTWIVISDATNNVEKIDDLTDGKSDNNGSSVFLGVYAGLNDDQSDNKNVGIGFRSLKNNTTGNRNVATGYYSLQSNTTGSENDASGYYSLYSNTTGYHNIALGNQSLQSNTTGYNNIGIGCLSLADNTTSTNNLAIGYLTLPQNTTGSYNVALGNESARINTTGSYNVANGYYSLQLNTTGSNNTALGNNSGYNSLGNANIFLGNRSGYFETGSNKLYIENSNANSSNALIYGEFGSNNTTTGNILRTNSEFQIGDPSTSGYKFPTARGTANQVLQSDATGVLTWQDGSDLGAQKIDDLTDGKSDNDGTNNGSSVFLGVNAGLNDDQSDNKNVGIGFESLKNNTTGSLNVANGYQALYSNTTGGANIASGYQALYSNTDGGQNISIGSGALHENKTGHYNIAIGHTSLYNNLTGEDNTANGHDVLRQNTSGSGNTSYGVRSLYSNTKGSNNVANGIYALESNITGDFNVAIGRASLFHNTAGSNNVALGASSGLFETGSNKLYIENTNANPSNALIYGEFGTDNTTTGNILRTNSEFQIGDPSLTGYKFPKTDGTVNQILQTNGNGQITWKNKLVISNDPDFPDGMQNIQPVFHNYTGVGSSTTYTVPVGKNFYITGVHSHENSSVLMVNSIPVLRGENNSDARPFSFKNPIIAGGGAIVTQSNGVNSINGFLVDAIVSPIITNNIPLRISSNTSQKTLI